MLSISGQAQQALEDNPDADTSALSSRLSSVMESSRHAQELIERMLAYRAASDDKPRTADLSETARRTLQLLSQSIGSQYNISEQIDEDLYAGEAQVVQLQKLLIQMFHAIVAGLPASESAIHTKLCREDYVDQPCICCGERIDGHYMELLMRSGRNSRQAKTALNLTEKLSGKDELQRSLQAMHSELAPLGGHILLELGAKGRQAWRLVLPVADKDRPGLNLDNSVQLEKYRQRRRQGKSAS